MFLLNSMKNDGRELVIMRGKERYKLRHAAGNYWLLDTEQKPGSYRAPIAMNETGATILQSYLQTGEEQEAAAILSKEYEIGMDEALEDVRGFLEQLRRQGIEL